MVEWLFRPYSPYRWPQWRNFKVYGVLGLVSWWAYFATDTLSRAGTTDRTTVKWTSPTIIVAGVLFVATLAALFKTYDTRVQLGMNWGYERAIEERQRRAEVARRTVGVTDAQVAYFRRWRTGAAVALVLFVVAELWFLVFGLGAQTIGLVDVLGGAFVAAIITALFLWWTSDGVAFTAELHLDTTPIGTIENDGRGGATTFRGRHHDVFGWRQMQEYVALCRRLGERVDEETLLNSLVDEFDLTAEITRAAKAGLTLVRLMDPQGRCLTIRAVAALNTTRLADLALHLTNDPVGIPGGVWQIWSTGGWRHVATIIDPQAGHEKQPR